MCSSWTAPLTLFNRQYSGWRWNSDVSAKTRTNYKLWLKQIHPIELDVFVALLFLQRAAENRQLYPTSWSNTRKVELSAEQKYKLLSIKRRVYRCIGDSMADGVVTVGVNVAVTVTLVAKHSGRRQSCRSTCRDSARQQRTVIKSSSVSYAWRKVRRLLTKRRAHGTPPATLPYELALVNIARRTDA